MISDHVFRGERACLYPVPVRQDADEFGLCGQPERAHRESADGPSVSLPHWFIGLRFCIGCGLGFDRPFHYLSPSRVKRVGIR